ncbi:MAG: hypothetical protein COW88_02900 [Candidatus Lloydbacteria bacterium CG22_combo_CG10-13_8_21_14_all_47_15]|uniref:Uncharacterized protein n=1 Tax=Candidatus Lloydbacteria bacterium CG22_combo_CG10-13_8_21_14_all_47_15 TaxID=1974635 RepID=A0A2H0CT85_9BACT|nr:MAG: hypothetical protein COW88_02900 [Candidatus Lloydbacteria bacterium CG22_combo_CG10-13_8_21_14_all_47_15]
MTPKEAVHELELRISEEEFLELKIRKITPSNWYFHEGFTHKIKFGTQLPLSPAEIEKIIAYTLSDLASEGEAQCVPLISPIQYAHRSQSAHIYCGFAYAH